jgi:serine/threonine protein kinase
MGVVYEAVQLSLQRHVAIKVLTANLPSDEKFRNRFRREAHLQAGFSHPHIVTVHDFGEDGWCAVSRSPCFGGHVM